MDEALLIIISSSMSLEAMFVGRSNGQWKIDSCLGIFVAR